MNSPIKDTNAERMEQIQRDQLQDALAEMRRGRPLTSREYRYREPRREDYKVAFIKIFIYGVIPAALGLWQQGAAPTIVVNDWGASVGVSIVVIAACMVLDAIFGFFHTSIRDPSFWDYLFPMQTADWGLLPIPLIHGVAVLYLPVGIVMFLLG